MPGPDEMKGKLLCRICGRPLREHDTIGPCPEAGIDGRVLKVTMGSVIDAYTSTLTCAERRGTDAGYHRHNRNREAPCDECREAHREVSRQQYWTNKKERQDA